MDLQWTEDLVQYRQLFDEWCAGQLAILDTNRQQHGQVLAEKSGMRCHQPCLDCASRIDDKQAPDESITMLFARVRSHVSSATERHVGSIGASQGARNPDPTRFDGLPACLSIGTVLIDWLVGCDRATKRRG